MDEDLRKIITKAMKDYSSLSEQKKKEIELENNMSCEKYMWEVYLGQIRGRSESLGIPLYLG